MLQTLPDERRGSPVKLVLNVEVSLAFVSLAALILDPLFGSKAALVFLAAGCCLIASAPGHSVQVLARYRGLLALPAFCLLSALWSLFPLLSLRYGLQLLITVCIAIVISSRVSAANLLRCLFCAFGIGVLGSVLFGSVREDIGAWIGIFDSKNSFASVIAGFMLTAIALASDRSAHRGTRITALAGAVISIPLMLKSQSAGWIAFLVPAVATSLAITFSRWMSSMQKLLTAILMLLLILLSAIVLLQYGDRIFGELLAYSGKDVTLTGRTDLWEHAFEIIREHPWLGLGYQAFWVHDYGPAEVLWAMFGIDSRSGFNFHNSYISYAVEVGLVGVAIQVMIYYGALAKTLAWAWRSPRPENAFYVSFLVMTICASFLESMVFFQFNVPTIIVICAFVHASR